MTTVRRVSPSEGEGAVALAHLINRSYADAQSELFALPSPRVSAESIAHLIAEGELVVAEREGEVVGVVRVRDLDEHAAFFGMLAVPPEVTSTGVARDLLDALEADAAGRGLDAMELDLLVPESPTPHQSRLQAWYERRGYERVYERPFGDVEPGAAAGLRQPTQLVRYAKRLARPARG